VGLLGEKDRWNRQAGQHGFDETARSASVPDKTALERRLKLESPFRAPGVQGLHEPVLLLGKDTSAIRRDDQRLDLVRRRRDRALLFGLVIYVWIAIAGFTRGRRGSPLSEGFDEFQGLLKLLRTSRNKS